MRLAFLVVLLASGCMTAAPSLPPLQIIPPPPQTRPVIQQSQSHGTYRQVQIRTQPDPLPCDARVHNFDWTPSEPVQVRRVFVWIGTTWQGASESLTPYHPIIDVWSTVQTQDGFVLAFLGLDHYQPFSGLHQIEKTFDPPLQVNKGDVLLLQHRCANYAYTQATSATFAILDLTE